MTTQTSPADDQIAGLFKSTFWQVCLADFPEHVEALRPLYAPGLAHVEGRLAKGQRAYDKMCAAFFERTDARWPRYDAHLAYWASRSAPVTSTHVDDDDEPAGPDTREMGELLAHRIVAAFYEEARKRRCEENAADRPVWRLVAIEDGSTPPECIAESRQLHHWQSPYWRQKKLPCEHLFCRCLMTAMTVREACDYRPPN